VSPFLQHHSTGLGVAAFSSIIATKQKRHPLPHCNLATGHVVDASLSAPEGR